MDNKSLIGKYIIVKDILFSDFMKTESGNIKIYDSLIEAVEDCGMYEFENVLIMKIEYNHVE